MQGYVSRRSWRRLRAAEPTEQPLLRSGIRFEWLAQRQLLQQLSRGHAATEQIALTASEKTGVEGKVRRNLQLFGLARGRDEDGRFPFTDQIQNRRISRPTHTELGRLPCPTNLFRRRAVSRPNVAISAFPTAGLARKNHMFPWHFGQPTPQPFFHERPVGFRSAHHPDSPKIRHAGSRRLASCQVTQRPHIICPIL